MAVGECGAYSARPCEVRALNSTLPHLAAEQTNTHTLQILRGDLQRNTQGRLNFIICSLKQPLFLSRLKEIQVNTNNCSVMALFIGS